MQLVDGLWRLIFLIFGAHLVWVGYIFLVDEHPEGILVFITGLLLMCPAGRRMATMLSSRN